MGVKYTKGPWKVMRDEYSGELHYMVVDASGAPLFDSVNRSPAASDETEHGDLVLAAAAPGLLDLACEFEAFAEAAMNDAIEEGDAMGEETWRVRLAHARSAIAKTGG